MNNPEIVNSSQKITEKQFVHLFLESFISQTQKLRNKTSVFKIKLALKSQITVKCKINTFK